MPLNAPAPMTPQRLHAGWLDMPAGFTSDFLDVYYGGITLQNAYTFYGSEGNEVGPTGGQNTYESRITALLEWANRHEFHVAVYRTKSPTVNAELRKSPDEPSVRLNVLLNRGIVTTSFLVGSRDHCLGYDPFVRSPEYTCAYCNESHSGETLFCTATGDLTVCTNCGSREHRTQVIRRGDQRYLNSVCGSCRNTCQQEDCTGICESFDAQFCDAHAEHATCINCENLLEWTDPRDEPERCNPRPRPRPFPQLRLRGAAAGARDAFSNLNQVIMNEPNRGEYIQVDADLQNEPVLQVQAEEELDFDHICDGCAPHMLCLECRGTTREIGYSEHFQTDVCEACEAKVRMNVTEDEDENDEALDVSQLEQIPGRENIRLCGVEIEGGHGSQTYANLIYHLRGARLTTARELGAYHGSPQGFVTVERDASVDWEAVTVPFNPASGEDMNKLNQTLRIIRGMVRRDELKFDLRCGLHIHVSADQVGLVQAYNLSHLFTYIEDPLFRIGAAKWPIHRACHTQNSARPLPKHIRKTEFYASQGGTGGGHDDHYFSLSFQNYFNAVLKQCMCGARANGFWDECTCQLKKCTFEFRLFNTTANSKKMLAYLALCQALVAKAIDMPEIRNPGVSWPGLAFNRQPLKSMDELARTNLTAAWVPRLQFIMNDLPLTEEERDAVRYCMLSSEIKTGIGEEAIYELTEREVVA